MTTSMPYYSLPDQTALREAIQAADLLGSDQVVIPRHAAQSMKIDPHQIAATIAQAMHDAKNTIHPLTANDSSDPYRYRYPSGGKIPAIKLLRMLTDLGLREAKGTLEEHLRLCAKRKEYAESKREILQTHRYAGSEPSPQNKE